MQIQIKEDIVAGKNDIPALVEMEMTNGDTIRAEQKGPFNHWRLSLKSGGELPSPFDGKYTNREEVDKAIVAYLQTRRGTVELGPSTRPEIQYKPGYGPGGKKLEK